MAGNIFGASDTSSDAFSNGGKLGVRGGSPEESVSFFVRFGAGVGVSEAASLALRLRGVLRALAWGAEAEDAVETKAREAPLVLGGIIEKYVGGKEGRRGFVNTRLGIYAKIRHR